jgi:hypothetical protein
MPFPSERINKKPLMACPVLLAFTQHDLDMARQYSASVMTVVKRNCDGKCLNKRLSMVFSANPGGYKDHGSAFEKPGFATNL